jgi:hypothetical protein
VTGVQTCARPIFENGNLAETVFTPQTHCEADTFFQEVQDRLPAAAGFCPTSSACRSFVPTHSRSLLQHVSNPGVGVSPSTHSRIKHTFTEQGVGKHLPAKGITRIPLRTTAFWPRYEIQGPQNPFTADVGFTGAKVLVRPFSSAQFGATN